MNSTIIIGKKYKETVYKGVKKAVDVIKLTYGYNGKYVKIDNGDEFKNDITNDGYKVAQEIYSDDPVEDIGCGIVREATKMTEQKIKNGTTTTAILIGGLFEGMVELPNDINILEVKDSIEHLAGAIIGYGEDNGETANSEYDIAFNSCHDKEMAEFVVSVMEEHDEFYETSKHYSDEYQIEYKKDERNTSLQLLSRKDSSEIKNPYVVVYDGIVNNTNVVNFSDTIFSWVKGKDTVLIIKNIDKWSVNHISARMMTHDKDIMLFTTVDGKTVDFVLDFYKKQPVLLANKMLLVNIMNGIEKIDDKGTVYGKVFMEDVDRKINELKKQISEGHNDYNADIIRKKINNYMGRTYKISLKSNSYNFEGQKDKFLDAVNDIINLRKSSYKVVDGVTALFEIAALVCFGLMRQISVIDSAIAHNVANSFYDKRKEGWLKCTNDILEVNLSSSEIERLAEQLDQHNFIDWNPTSDESGKIIISEGRITANGVDIVEQGGTIQPIKIVIDKSISITDSNNVQIGNNNTLNNLSLKDLFISIEKAELNENEKKDIKEKLNSIIKHPAVLLALQTFGKMAGI